jgi:hypothetical protein
MRRVLSASWTSRPASCFMSSGQPLVAPHQLAEGDDGRQRVVEFVSHARHELADGLHLLGLEQLPLETLLVRQVADQVEEAALAAQLHDSNLDLHGELRAVRPAAPVAEGAPPWAQTICRRRAISLSSALMSWPK